jgi:hypothetical protein
MFSSGHGCMKSQDIPIAQFGPCTVP